jgi:hypothetical protein
LEVDVEMTDTRPAEQRKLSIGFRTSIVTLFVAVVLFVGLTLVYLSFSRVSLITRTAASTFIDKVAQLGASRIDSKFRNVLDSLEILAGLPSIQSAEIVDNTRLYGLMASMLKSNPQIFNLYIGYEDGSFLEMDVIDRAKPQFRQSLNIDEDAAYRVVIISRTGAASRPAEALQRNHYPHATLADITEALKAQKMYSSREWRRLYSDGTVTKWLQQVSDFFMTEAGVGGATRASDYFDTSIYLSAI